MIRVERQDSGTERTVAADDHFANIVSFFVDAVRGRTDNSAWTAASLHQSALVDAIMAGARIIDCPSHR